MIIRSVKFFWSLLVFAAVLWFALFVPLGERTLFQHIMRIAQTDEAQDLGREVNEAGRRMGDEVERTVEESARERLDRDRAARAGGAPQAVPRAASAPATSTRRRVPTA